MLALMLSTFLAGLDTSIIGTMLPKISEKFEALTLMAWIISSYMIGITALLPLYGKLCQIFGYKNVLLTCHALFLVGSIICGASNSAGMLIAGRTIAGLGGGGLKTINFITVSDLAPPSESVMYFALFSLMWGIAAVAGPLLGGVFADKTGFEWGFYINPIVQVFIVALVIIFMRIPRTKTTITNKLKRIDFAGIAALVIGIVMLQLGLTWGGQDYPWKSAAVIISLVLAVILLVVFVIIEWIYAVEPIMPLRLFKHRNTSIMLAVQMTFGMCYYLPPYYYPIYLTVIRNNSALDTGLHMIPVLLSLSVASLTTGFIVKHTGAYLLAIWIGIAINTAGVGLFVLLGNNPSNGMLIGIPIVFGAGLGIAVQPTLTCAQNTVKHKDVATTTSLYLTLQMLGGALGQAVAQSILRNRISPMLDNIADKFPNHADAVENVIKDPTVIWKPNVPINVRNETIDAYVKSIHVVYYVFLAFGIFTFVCSLFVKNISLRNTIDKDNEDSDN
ncbi:MFS general substrate transporter [Coemansia reversa NRRL 1564]|uniref:MFS general substrate transporter n=1 Tax=Coemansia reversa (strain ATCC 12441 / NRRL 1564) TaxID=763665 RepID=A0A2G5B5H6_COERN|nr:MFS general substrate transporter [Coemansia reversa NRRL 1564]|eukprot:PIA14265.1 MFS general substrate transporter [Coemansia reversa NRRL 1564]